jgi:hypothetical protein
MAVSAWPSAGPARVPAHGCEKLAPSAKPGDDAADAQVQPAVGGIDDAQLVAAAASGGKSGTLAQAAAQWQQATLDIPARHPPCIGGRQRRACRGRTC